MQRAGEGTARLPPRRQQPSLSLSACVLVLLGCFGAGRGAGVGAAGTGRFLVTCRMASETDRRFVFDQVAQHGLDTWTDEIAGTAIKVLAGRAQIAQLRKRLVCGTEVDVKVLLRRAATPPSTRARAS